MVLIKLPRSAMKNKFWNPDYRGSSEKHSSNSKKRKKEKFYWRKVIGKSYYDPYDAYMHEKEFHRKYGY